MAKSYPLSSTQFDIYLDQLIYPTSSLYSIAEAVFIDTQIDACVFKQCLQALIEQHDALRLSLCGEKAAPRQAFLLSGNIEWLQVDLCHYQDDREAVLQWLTHEVNKAIDMFSAPLYRFYLIKLSANRYCWLHKYHHLIADGWSISIYANQVLSAYFDNTRQQPFTGQNVSYRYHIDKDHRYLNSPRYQQDKNYWLSKDCWTIPPALVKNPLHDNKRHSGQLRFRLEAKLKTDLLKLAEQERSSLQQIWMAAICLYFCRIHTINHLILGLSLANRANSTERMLGGMFATIIPVAIKVEPADSVQNLLQKIAGELRKDYRHRRFPITQLAKLLDKHHTAESSLFQVAFTYLRYDYQELDVSDRLHSVLLQSTEKQLPLSVWVIDSSRANQMEVVIDFNEHYFSHSQAIVFKNVLLHLLATLPEVIRFPISELALVSAEERQYLLKGLHNNTYPRPIDKTIKDLMSAQFLTVPENISVIYQQHSLSYRLLSLKVNYLAALLREKGVTKGDVVPVCMEQGLELPITLLAILQCGAAFFNLDPKWPELRIMHLLAGRDYPVMVTNVEVIALKFLDKAVICVAYENLGEATHSIDAVNLPDDLIYCFSTSGTTSEPKIAQNIHRGIFNRFLYMNRVFGEGARHRILQTSGFNFDSSLWQILWPLCNGATLVMPEPLQRHNIHQLLHLMSRHAITMTDFVPSFFAVFVEHLQGEQSDIDNLKTLEFLLIGGEAMDIHVTNRFKQLCPWVRVFNTYGPTETSIGVIFQELHGNNNSSAPLGRPIDNVYALILDTYHALCPFGSPGELYLTGECVGVGYLDNHAATQAAFIDNPFAEIPYSTLYKTGDKVCYGEDEAIYFLGRVDEQIKINGIRIEPREIALTIEQLPSVNKAVVTTHALESGRKILVAYVQSHPKLAIRDHEIMAYVKSHLPSSMIPELIQIIDEFPLSANGKLNIKALPKPELAAQQGQVIPPRFPHEQVLMDIWQTVLEKPIESMASNFFDLGGNSLLFVSLISQVEKQFKIQLPYKELSELLTLASMSEKIIQMPESPVKHTPQTTPHKILGTEPLNAELYRQLLLVTAEWQGVKQCPDAIMTGLNTEIEAIPLFWCLQNYNELAQLGLHFAGERPIYGLRSGHNIMEYTPHTIYQLASHYVKEILELPFSGPYIVGGNCQGALIAMSVAKQLWMNDKEVSLLFSMEESPKNLYHGRIAMIFGRESKFNPYKDNVNPIPEWSKYYRGTMSYDEISGQHGKFFISPNIETLAEVLKRRIQEVTMA